MKINGLCAIGPFVRVVFYFSSYKGSENYKDIKLDAVSVELIFLFDTFVQYMKKKLKKMCLKAYLNFNSFGIGKQLIVKSP